MTCMTRMLTHNSIYEVPCSHQSIHQRSDRRFMSAEDKFKAMIQKVSGTCPSRLLELLCVSFRRVLDWLKRTYAKVTR